MVERGISVRSCTTKDEAFLRGLYADLRAPELALVDWPQASTHAFFHSQFDLQHAHYLNQYPHADFLIVTQTPPAGRPMDIGRVYLDRTTHRWRLIDIGILRAWRSQCVGYALIDWIKQAAITASAETVDLSVANDNSRAQAFYSRLGFGLEGENGQSHRAMSWRVS